MFVECHPIYSATWLPGVQRIADQYLKDPVRVNVGSMDLQACHSVTQLVEFINPEDKQDRVNKLFLKVDCNLDIKYFFIKEHLVNLSQKINESL